jgi:hypothetical protein
MRPSDALTLHRAALRQLLNRYGFKQPRVFGSVLTRTDTEESDLDVWSSPCAERLCSPWQAWRMRRGSSPECVYLC